MNENLRPKFDQAGFDYSIFKTEKTYEQDFCFNTLD